jgi:hypothetical protein
MAKMEEGYFDEKRGLALEHVDGAANDLAEAKALISALGYNSPTLVEPSKVHDAFRGVTGDVRSARRDYEKARWAAADLEPPISFEEWLSKHGHDDLLN